MPKFLIPSGGSPCGRLTGKLAGPVGASNREMHQTANTTGSYIVTKLKLKGIVYLIVLSVRRAP